MMFRASRARNAASTHMVILGYIFGYEIEAIRGRVNPSCEAVQERSIQDSRYNDNGMLR